MNVKVSVVIPNYNGISYLEQCLDSLMAQSVRSFEIIVVDDGSSDGSLERAQAKYPPNEAFPRTRYIRHARNMGFCRSVNDGIRASQADYVFLLNNDTVADPECVRELYQAIGKDERIFSVGAKMVSLKNAEVMDNAGDCYCALGWAFTPAKDKAAPHYNRKKRIFSACGGAALYRKELLEKIGLFDENHFAYLEDVDIGYRADLYGFYSVFAPKAVVQHAGSASSGSRYNAFKARLTARNNVYLMYKNMPSWQLLLNAPLLLAGTAIKLAFYCSKGLGKPYAKGLSEGIRLCHSFHGKRRRLDFKSIGAARLWKMELTLLKNLFLLLL